MLTIRIRARLKVLSTIKAIYTTGYKLPRIEPGNLYVQDSGEIAVVLGLGDKIKVGGPHSQVNRDKFMRKLRRLCSKFQLSFKQVRSELYPRLMRRSRRNEPRFGGKRQPVWVQGRRLRSGMIIPA